MRCQPRQQLRYTFRSNIPFAMSKLWLIAEFVVELSAQFPAQSDVSVDLGTSDFHCVV
jgi:hypothetical protein